ncbi:MAG: sensor histidine kinase [Peptococcaceae bacterium]
MNHWSKSRHRHFFNKHNHYFSERRELYRYHSYVRLYRPGVLIFNILIIIVLFKWLGTTPIALFFAAVITFKEIFQLHFFRRLQKRIFEPLEKLRSGVEEITKGNYHVKIEARVPNEIGVLINSFNNMAEKLQQSEKLKLEYEENRKNLIANISHDLKTPITSIQGYIEGILDGAAQSPAKTARYLRIIYNNSLYINKLIDDLFLFSKLDMKKLDFNFEKVAIKAFMEDIMEEFRLELAEKQVELIYRDSVTHAEAACIDPKRIHQALRNIIGNSVRYGDAGGNLVIDVSVVRAEDLLSITVTDNGPGIPEDKIEHIFERFYRVDSERTKNFMSTGLGLAITKELIEAHNGQISVTSKEGEGAAFTILLPVMRD